MPCAPISTAAQRHLTSGKVSNASGCAAPTGSLPLPGHRTTLTLLMLAYTLSMCDRMILSILFPDIKAEFGLSDTQLGLLGGISFALFYATMGLPIARLSDQYSRKWIILVSLIVFSLMTAFSGLAAGLVQCCAVMLERERLRLKLNLNKPLSRTTGARWGKSAA